MNQDIKGLVESIKNGTITDLLPLIDLLREQNDWRWQPLSLTLGHLFHEQTADEDSLDVTGEVSYHIYRELDRLFFVELRGGWDVVQSDLLKMEQAIAEEKRVAEERKKAKKRRGQSFRKMAESVGLEEKQKYTYSALYIWEGGEEEPFYGPVEDLAVLINECVPDPDLEAAIPTILRQEVTEEGEDSADAKAIGEWDWDSEQWIFLDY